MQPIFMIVKGNTSAGKVEKFKVRCTKPATNICRCWLPGKLIKWVKGKLKMNMTIVKRTDKTIKCEVQPKRWIIERTFAWLLNVRRLAINYERTTESAISY